MEVVILQRIVRFNHHFQVFWSYKIKYRLFFNKYLTIYIYVYQHIKYNTNI